MADGKMRRNKRAASLLPPPGVSAPPSEVSSRAPYSPPVLPDDPLPYLAAGVTPQTPSEAAGTPPDSAEKPGDGSGEVSAFDARVGLARRRLETAVRDELGFAAHAVALTREQVKWVTHRMDSETDGDADESAGVDPIKRALWMSHPDFRALYDTCQDNRREAMRLLGSQMLPQALRTIHELLTGDSIRGKQVGLAMLLRSQGLLIDKQVRSDPDALAATLAMLREHREPEIVTGFPGMAKVLPARNLSISPEETGETAETAELAAELGNEDDAGRGLPNRFSSAGLGLEQDVATD